LRGCGIVIELPDSSHVHGPGPCMCEAVVMWMTGQVMTLNAGWLEVISESI